MFEDDCYDYEEDREYPEYDELNEHECNELARDREFEDEDREYPEREDDEDEGDDLPVSEDIQDPTDDGSVWNDELPQE